MKKIIIAFSLLVCLQLSASGQFTIGGGATYAFPGSDFGFHAKGLLGVGEKFDFSPGVGIFLGDGTPFFIDADVQYELFEIGDGFRFLPFAGINFLKTTDTSTLGLNLGGSIRFDVNENTVYIEPKVSIFTYKGMALSGGIFF